MKQDQEPELVRHDDVHGDVFEHPAYGQIGVSRVTGQTTLYDSEFEHRAYMTIRIWRSQLHRDLGRDWHFGHRELIEIALSEAQWATFVSSPNIGTGVPCTLERVAGERMPSIPLRHEREVVSQELHEHADEMATKVTKAIAEIEGEIGSSLSKKKREAVLRHLRALEMALGSNVPFYIQQFEEHIENTVEKAKVEVGAYVQATLQRAGLEALQAEAPVRMITGSEDESEP